MNMAMLQQIAQTKSHHQVHLEGTEIPVPTQDTTIDPCLAMTIEIDTIAMIIKTDIDLAGRNPIPTVIDTGVIVKEIHEGVAPGHITDPHTAAHHATESQVHIATNRILQIEDRHHTEVFTGIAVNPDHIHHTKSSAKHHQNCLTALTGQLGKKDRKYEQVTIDDPPSEYYSSDEPSSKPNEDLN